MTNLEQYDKLFMQEFRLSKEQLPGLKYRGIPAWDSVGHMDLMSALEEAFGINISTPDLLSFSSYEAGKEILARYGVEI